MVERWLILSGRERVNPGVVGRELVLAWRGRQKVYSGVVERGLIPEW